MKTCVYENLISFAGHHVALIQMGVQALLQLQPVGFDIWCGGLPRGDAILE
jgi:hypothetical protein